MTAKITIKLFSKWSIKLKKYKTEGGAFEQMSHQGFSKYNSASTYLLVAF